MSIHRKLTTGCAVAVLAFGLAACGSSDDDDTPTAMMPMGTPVAFADLEMGQTVEAGTYAVSDPSVAFLAAIEDFELPEGGYAPGAMESVGGLDFTCAADSAANCNVVVNEDGSITTTGTIEVAMTPPPLPPLDVAIMGAVTAASEAATAAQTAADDAQTAADEATTAAANRAWIQTRSRSSYSSAMAINSAADAQESADAAKAAAEDAAAAEDVTAAIEARILAEQAQADAEVAKQDAEDARDEAQARAMAELKINDKTKSVGDKSITVTAEQITHTQGTVTRTYGLLTGMDIEAEKAAVNGSEAVTADEEAGIAAKAATPDVLAASIDVGMTFDSVKDDARLTLVTKYLGSTAVNVFSVLTGTTATGTTAGTVTEDRTVNDAQVPVTVNLQAAAGTYLETTGTGTVDENHSVDLTTKSAMLYYYNTGMEDDADTKTRDESKQYVQHLSTVRDPGNDNAITYTYEKLDVVSGVRVPESKDFQHLHYGLWNDLTPATASRANTLVDRGIAFVTGVGDAARTEDLPTFGDASYAGNWVANIKAVDPTGDGAITRQTGDAAVTADFQTSEVDVDLTGLATFDAEIDRGAAIPLFITTEANVTGTVGGLNPAAKYSGQLTGAFFGPQGAEAGGTFSFGTKGHKDGAFRGAFGTARQPDTDRD